MNMQTILIILTSFMLTGCGGFWETYGKRSELTIGYYADNVGVNDKQGERKWKADGTIRGSNTAIEKVFRSMTEFSMKELGLK